MELVQSENSYKVRISVTKRLFVQSEFVQSEGRTKRGIAVLSNQHNGIFVIISGTSTVGTAISLANPELRRAK